MISYADHIAALAEARDRGYSEAMDDGWGEPGHIKVAVAAALADVREAVAATYSWPYGTEPQNRVAWLSDAIAAIDKLTEDK